MALKLINIVTDIFIEQRKNRIRYKFPIIYCFTVWIIIYFIYYRPVPLSAIHFLFFQDKYIG
jgi:hypothetical protein